MLPAPRSRPAARRRPSRPADRPPSWQRCPLRFTVALWPVYGWGAIVVSIMLGYGIAFHALAFIPMPMPVQNVLLFGLYTAFLYTYLGVV